MTNSEITKLSNNLKLFQSLETISLNFAKYLELKNEFINDE